MGRKTTKCIYILSSVTIQGRDGRWTKWGLGLYEWCVKIGEMQRDMIDLFVISGSFFFLAWIDPIDRPSGHEKLY